MLKNALDFLYREWEGKPASFLTYGTRGGSKAAVQFASVLQGLHMQVLDEHVEAIITDDDVDEDWQLADIDATLTASLPLLQKIEAQLTEALA